MSAHSHVWKSQATREGTTLNTSDVRALIIGVGAAALQLGFPLAHAETFAFAGTVTSCTPTCSSFPFLGADPGDPNDHASVLAGSITIDDAALADGAWTGADVTAVSFTVLDTAKPIVASDPPDPATDNPFTLDQTQDGGGIIVASGAPITNPRGTWLPCVPPQTQGCVIASSGTFDGTRLDSGLMDLWLTQGLLAANGAVIHIDFAVGTFAVNIFENLIFIAGGDLDADLASDVTLTGVSLESRRGLCRNLTTGQTLGVPAADGKAILCEVGGLIARPGDQLSLTLVGVVRSPAMFAGVALGMSVEQARCTNMTKNLVVQFDPPGGSQVLACKGAGLLVDSGDVVSINAVGTAQ
jgi:hypothetical protein